MEPPSAVIVCDWFRAHPFFGSGSGTARGNTYWLAGILSAGLGQPVTRQSIVLPDVCVEGFLGDLNNETLSKIYSKDPLQGWLASRSPDFAETVFAPLFDKLPPDALVVGFELSPTIRRILNTAGRRYLSVHIHPLRFLPDLVFGVYSNCPRLQATLSSAAVPDAAINQQVARLSARVGRLQPAQAKLPRQCPVLFGQTVSDASLIIEGRFGDWRDYREPLSTMLKDFKYAGFVRHPHAGWPCELLDWLSEDLGVTAIAMSGNSYPIIMSGAQLGPVISLSSSIGVEAEAFGHSSNFLIGDPRELFAVPGLDNPAQIMIGHQLLQRELWTAMLDDYAAPSTIPADPFVLGANHVRDTLEAWAFAGVSGNGPLPRCTKIVVPSARCSRAELAGLQGELGDRSAEDVGDGTQTSHHDVDLRSLPASLRVGETWAWKGEGELLDLPAAEGLCEHEGEGAWLTGTSCRIRIPINAEKAREVEVSGLLRFSFFRGMLDRFPALLLSADGAPIAAWVHRGQADPYHELPFTFAALSGQICHLTLEASHADSPSMLGMGEDARRLSVNVHGLSLTVSATSHFGPATHLSLWGFGTCALELPTTRGTIEDVANG